MKKINLTISIPRFNEEQSAIKENTRLVGAFLDLCENSPDQVVESDIQSFFDAYGRLEAIYQELVLSEWAHGRDLSRVVKDVLATTKSAFDDLDISVQCRYDNDHTESLIGFEQIRKVF